MPIQFSNGKILFTDNGIAFDEACCCGCSHICAICSGCQPELAVELSGVTGPGCCTDANTGGTPVIVEQLNGGPTRCLWSFDYVPLLCTLDHINVATGRNTTGTVPGIPLNNYFMGVELHGDISGVFLFASWGFLDLGASLPDCTLWSTPLVLSNDFSSPSQPCDYSSSTVTVASVP
jgi:hypothetical protein